MQENDDTEYDKENFDVDQYVNRMDEILDRKIEIYSDLKSQFFNFRSKLKEEEDASHQVTGAFYY
jgi:hypothetical protein